MGESFHHYLAPLKIDTNLADNEKYEQFVMLKTKMLGNVRLIGQLLIRQMVSWKIVFHIADELFAISSVESLETLCVFLDTIGSTFDTPDWPGYGRMSEIFVRIELMKADTRECPRIRCLMQNLLDKRLN